MAELKRALKPDKTQSQVFMALIAFKIFSLQKCCTFGRSGYKMKTSIRSMLLVFTRIIVYAPLYLTMLLKYTN